MKKLIDITPYWVHHAVIALAIAAAVSPFLGIYAGLAASAGTDLEQEFHPRHFYDCEEAVVPLDADRATFVELVNAEGGDGETLADGWFVNPTMETE